MTEAKNGVRRSVSLRFGADGMMDSCTVVEGGYSGPSKHRSRDGYSVREGHLLSNALACGDPAPLRIQGQTLTLGGEDGIVLHRQAADEAVDGCK